ncbi:hypothetical protein [Actinomadura sp. 9N215]|uniref:hypothetical protein n=1 Tax=Actinomadura sp. 9N215 TaxID=3375150 RepID=UPI0037B20780
MTARTPEQDEARRTAEEEPAGSRQVRRRLTFGVAGDLAGMPATLSPWQRAYEAWRAAGLRWGHGAPPRQRTERPADAPDAPKPAKPESRAPESAQPEPAERKPANPKATKPKPAKPKPAKREPATPKGAKRQPASRGTAGGRAKPDPGDVLVAGPPKPAPEALSGLRSRLAVAVGLVVVAGGVVVGASWGDEKPATPAGVPGPVAADALFATDPAAATDGLVQELTAVASTGGTIVAAGAEGDGVPGRERPRFLVSRDGGHAWSVAEVRSADGSAPPTGDGPRHVAGSAGDWLALGRSSDGGPVAWTSATGDTWTRQPLAAPFKPSDTVNALTHGDGDGGAFVAAGTSAGRAVVWTTADRRTWQRTEGPRGVTNLDRVASHGNVLVVHGIYSRRVTAKKGRKKVTRTVRSDGLWRSADGGRTWTLVTVPQAQGSYGPTKGLAAGPGWFATVREGKRTIGRKKKRRTQQFGVLFTSVDGQRWQAASRFDGHGIERFGGSGSGGSGGGGVAVLVQGAKGARTILQSDDGRTWRSGGAVPAAVESSGLTIAARTPVISGRQGNDAYLSGVDLRTVPGAVRPERSIRSLAAAPGRTVAVGSTNGGTALWTAPDGRAWTRARFPGTGGWLSDVVHGGKGWLAVGRTSGASPGPLALTSQGGLTWRKSPFPGGPPPVAATSGPAGYVAVGTGAAWRSADLRAWRRTLLDGVPADVTATATGKYVVVGGRGKAPAVWTSPDGMRWTPARLPSGLATGPLTEIAAHGDVLVAIGAGATALVSSDGGTTWAPHGLGADVTATAVTVTPDGFVVAASTSKGDGAVLASADGVTWSRIQVPGLSGPGDQRLTALTAAGSAVLAVGTTSGARSESPLLWYASVPK